MAQLLARRADEEWLLSGGSITYRISAINVGLGTIRRLRQRGPFQHGLSNRGFRLDERRIELILFFQAPTLAEAVTRRDLIAEIFKPVEDIPLQLEWTRDDGSVRAAVGYVDGNMDFADTPMDDRMGVSQRFTVPFQLMDTDPVFFDPAPKYVLFSTLSSNGFQIPMDVPAEGVTNTDINATQSVAYQGSWREYPTIYVTGPAEDIKITNLTTGEMIYFPTLALDVGEVLTIDLGYEEKTAITDVQGDVVPLLSEDSDIVSFKLETTPKAPSGVNDIKVEIVLAATAATKVEMVYFDRYISM